MTQRLAVAPRRASGKNCVAYPALGEPAKLSRGNPGRRCFACQERRAARRLGLAVGEDEVARPEKAGEPRRGWSGGLETPSSGGHADADSAREVVERRKRSVLTCERGLRSALASGDERLARRWSKSLREAEERLAWAEADLARTEPAAPARRAR